MKNAKIFLIFSLAVFIIVLFGFKNVLAEDCESMPSGNQGEVTAKIACLNGKLGQLSQAASTLKNQIAQFNAQISLTTLKITETQDKIDLLGGRINTLETSLTDLTNSFSARAVATYMMARGNEPIFLLLSANNVPDALAKFHYLEKIQSADYDLLIRLQTAQDNYKVSKQDSEDLQKQLQAQQNTLTSQKAAKAQLLSATRSDETKYQQLLASARTQLLAFQKFVVGQGGASILSNQTVCNDWGCYYNQRDANWGNRGLGSSSLSVAEYGCLVSSSAMVATHYKKNLTPGDIAGNTSAFFSPDPGTALMWKDITVNGVRIVRNSVTPTTASIDGELAAGRPVIVGLYSGPAHFIVLKSGSNGNYVMNDPFMPNGHDVNFSSKYSTGVITDVETVSVQ